MCRFFLFIMRIETNHNSVAFKSLRTPVKPFVIDSSKGNLYCYEADYSINNDIFFKNIAKFFLDIFANTSSHPFWKNCRGETINKRIYSSYINSSILKYKKSFKDYDTTLLLVENANNKLIGAAYTRPLHFNHVLKDDNTLYIDSLAISPQYRKQGIGENILSKILRASDQHFSEAFLVAYKEAVPFYEKLNFTKMNAKDPKQQFAISELIRERIDYPDYADFMQKDLGKKLENKWYDRIKKTK